MVVRFALAVLATTWMAGASAQTPATVADFTGTWNIEFMSHQIALVIEPKDTTHVTATMMMMGRDLPLTGELVGRTLTLVGQKEEGGAAPVAPAGAERHAPPARPIVVTLQDDGTIAGEMMTTQGPGRWTGERLRKRK